MVWWGVARPVSLTKTILLLQLLFRKCGKRAVLLDDNDDVVTNVHFRWEWSNPSDFILIVLRAKDKLKAGEVINTGVYGIQIDAQLKGNQYWESVKRTNPLFSQLYEGDEPRRVTESETSNEPVAHTLSVSNEEKEWGIR